jgi:hypothetical protein
MDQRSIALCAFMKGLSAKAIHQELIQTLHDEAFAYPAVTWYFRVAKFPAQGKATPDEAGVMRNDSVDADILKALTDNPFSSVRELSWVTCLFKSTVHRCLTESPGLTVRHLYWIRHCLSNDQKTIRVNLSRELMRVPQGNRPVGCTTS